MEKQGVAGQLGARAGKGLAPKEEGGHDHRYHGKAEEQDEAENDRPSRTLVSLPQLVLAFLLHFVELCFLKLSRNKLREFAAVELMGREVDQLAVGRSARSSPNCR